MVFSSIVFIFFFLPATLALHFLAPKRYKNSILLLMSLVFYFIGEPKYVLLMIAYCMISYAFGLLIEHFRGKIWERVFLFCCVALCLGGLIFFKYTDFLIATVGDVFRKEIPLLKLALPIGISFYTFQALSYVVDIYRGEVAAQRSFIGFSTYLAMFPQLAAGPIVRYSSIEKSLINRNISTHQFASGVRRFVIGLGKKVLLANVLGEFTQAYAKTSEITVLFTWIYVIAYCLQVYFDFSGYSDMAIGLGRMFGFDFPENFNYPFISRSISEFWRRWHMTLGAWFRDYVYIPMGGNRVPAARWLLNILVVWALTGLWHGAQWSFVVWGLYFAVFLALERLVLKKVLEKSPALIRHIYVIVVIGVSFLIFGAESLSVAWTRIAGVFGYGMAFSSAETWYHIRSFAAVIAAGVIGATPLPKMIFGKINGKGRAKSAVNLLEPIALAAILLLATAYLVDGSFNPFLYFRF